MAEKNKMAEYWPISAMAQLKLPSTLQGQCHVKGIAVVQSEGPVGMSDREQRLLVQEYMQQVHSLKLCKDIPSLQ